LTKLEADLNKYVSPHVPERVLLSRPFDQGHEAPELWPMEGDGPLASGSGFWGGVALAWANNVVHVVLPLYGVLDWILFSDRPPVPWRRIWVPLTYPVVCAVVVLIRGAIDGWVPYPFLDPATGYGSVAIYCLAIAAFSIVAAAGAWAASRLKIIRLSRDSDLKSRRV
jgi:hypothetical protein